MHTKIIRLINGNDSTQTAIISIADESIVNLYDRALDFAAQLWGESEDHQAEDIENTDNKDLFLDDIDNYEE